MATNENRYLYQRGNAWNYKRRVPSKYKHVDSRSKVRASLETKSLDIARIRRDAMERADEAYWAALIACSKEAKARGVKNVMKLADAKKACPELVLQCQSPDLYRRAHNALLAEINSVIPVEAVKSIDELCCKLDPKDIADPIGLSERLKAAIAEGVGPFITCSIGFAANRHLAKIACKMDKPDGTTIWHPHMMPAPLIDLPFDDIPGIGGRMALRLFNAGIHNMADLMATEPKVITDSRPS